MISNTRNAFSSAKWALSPIRQLLVSSNMSAIIVMLVILVVHRCHDELHFFKKDYRKCCEDVEKLEPLCVARGNVKLHNHYGSNLTDPK